MDIQEEARAIVKRLSLEEKVSLLSGRNSWQTREVPGVPSIFMTDGPHGLRKALNNSLAGVPATAFPTASALASSWNVDLLRQVGAAIGVEAQTNDVQVVLGPGVNMKRSPLGGRNFEYFSEDPVLAADMATAHVKGLQSEGVGASLKHFAANNQEFERMQNSSEIDERTLHEIYLRAFELTVRRAQPWSLMASYNQINGTQSTESAWLLQGLLRDTWGHKGIVVSDWAAAALNRPTSLKAGTHLEMPGGSDENTQAVLAAVRDGSLKESVVTERTEQLVENILKVARSKRVGVEFSPREHHELARAVARETIVLLKNDKKTLPLKPEAIKKVAVIGRFARAPRFQGGGSSQITPTEVDTLWDELERLYGDKIKFTYADGYEKDTGATSKHLLDEAAQLAKKSDAVLVAVGLPPSFETEGLDRPQLDLPAGHNQLVAAVAAANDKTIVLLTNGSAVTMPWLDQVPAVIEGWLSGQASAGALAEIIGGLTNPSGHLSETFPRRIEDTPAYPDFPNRTGHARYGEGIFIGYRWYDARNITPLFPFGFGLSYTTFSFSNLKIVSRQIFDDQSVTVSVDVKNNGDIAGKVAAQLYLSHHDSTEVHPVRELKAFAKVALGPNERKTVSFELGVNELSFYSEIHHGWHVPAGTVTIAVGGSSRDLPLADTITITPRHAEALVLTRDSTLKEFSAHPRGSKFYNLIAKQMVKGFVGGGTMSDKEVEQLMALTGDLPLSRLPALSGGLIDSKFVDAVVRYCHHEGGFHPLETFPYYGELGKLVAKALRPKK